MSRERKKTSAGPKLAEVAEAAGVSKMTASRVFRDVGGFSDDTRKRVLDAAQRLGYVPDRIAAAFGSEAASTLVGVIVPRLTGGLFGGVVEGIDQALSRFGYQTMIGTSEHSPELLEKWLHSLLSWRPAGVILTGRGHSAATNAMLRASGLPVVEIWELNTRPMDISVGINHFDCGHEMGRFLLSRGRQRIGFLGADAGANRMSSQRLSGFRQALCDDGRDIVAQEILRDAPSYYSGFYGTEMLLSRKPDLDAIYYQNDAMAIGGIFYCQSRGVSVPGDVGIAGWGGMEIASILPQRLTTTRISAMGLGKSAAEALVARIRGEPVHEVIETGSQLVPGATV